MLRKLFGAGRPGTARGPRRAVAALLAVAAVAVGAWILVVHGTADRPAGCPAGLARRTGQCVGVTDGSYVFAPALAGVEHAIDSQDARVMRSGHYVTVALLAQFTEGPGSVVSVSRMLDELQGAYAEQFSADSASQEDVSPPIRLVLANEGNQEAAWPLVTRQLTAMTSSPAHLVAVIGMGVSDTPTMDGARALSRAGIPMIGSVITADSLDWQHFRGLARVVPSNGAQVAALRQYVAAHGGLRRSLLISDDDSSDLYTSNLAADFSAAFRGHVITSEPYGPSTRSGNEFALIAPNICPDGPGAPATVLYAGREIALPELILQIRTTPNCVGKQVSILTGSDAAALDPAVTAPRPGSGQVTVYYSNLVDTGAVTRQVQAVFAASGEGAATSRAGTWTIATYNALSVAAHAIRAATGSSAALPSRALVLDCVRLLTGQARIGGATGPFSITNSGEESGLRIPVFRDAGGTGQAVVP